MTMDDERKLRVLKEFADAFENGLREQMDINEDWVYREIDSRSLSDPESLDTLANFLDTHEDAKIVVETKFNNRHRISFFCDKKVLYEYVEQYG
jgi:hypothetical protein